MALGDDALAAGMDIVLPTEDRRNGADEITKTRDYIAQRTSAVTPIEKGGTGQTTAAAARAALGADDAGNITKGILPTVRGGTGVSNVYSNTAPTEANGLVVVGSNGALRRGAGAMNPAYIPTLPISRIDGLQDSIDTLQGGINDVRGGLNGKLNTSGGVVTGDIFLPNASPANVQYAVAYLNGDGRISRGASSERYKEQITEIDPADLGDIFPALHRFQMRDGDGTWRYGWIAERLAEHHDQAAFVVRDEDGRPDSIDFIALLIAQNSQLIALVDDLRARIARLEEAD
jgi:hypothetical protein